MASAVRAMIARVLEAGAVAGAQAAAQQAAQKIVPAVGQIAHLPKDVADLKARVEQLEQRPSRRKAAKNA